MGLYSMKMHAIINLLVFKVPKYSLYKELLDGIIQLFGLCFRLVLCSPKQLHWLELVEVVVRNIWGHQVGEG